MSKKMSVIIRSKSMEVKGSSWSGGTEIEQNLDAISIACAIAFNRASKDPKLLYGVFISDGNMDFLIVAYRGNKDGQVRTLYLEDYLGE